MVLELVTYGPTYFWVISVMLVSAFFPQLVFPAGVTMGSSVKVLADLSSLGEQGGRRWQWCLQRITTWAMCSTPGAPIRLSRPGA